MSIDVPLLVDLVRGLLRFLKKSPEELSLYFVTEETICSLHQEFFDDPTSTDCISFPMDDTYLGEVFVCPKVASEYAKKHQTSPYNELVLYIVHGILHLIGFDDIEQEDRLKMRQMEEHCFTYLKSQPEFKVC